jgi:uncharacterized cupin superfamily protein
MLSRILDRVTFTRKHESIYGEKGQTLVHYYLFPEYEVHHNEILPGAVQEWHHHREIVELIYVISGTLEVRWLEGGRVRKEKITSGDCVQFGILPHTLANLTRKPTNFIVFKMVPDGIDKREILKNDRFPVPTPSS